MEYSTPAQRTMISRRTTGIDRANNSIRCQILIDQQNAVESRLREKRIYDGASALMPEHGVESRITPIQRHL